MQVTGIGRGTGRADQIGDFIPFAHLIISLHLVSDLDVLFCAETSASHEIGIWWCMSESETLAAHGVKSADSESDSDERSFVDSGRISTRGKSAHGSKKQDVGSIVF
ncbi:uncharacterized protein LOC120710433 isoform X1 [Panicum virgatum]|uniref:uncharacterized protein LOC120710433 isoform X1 n=1 Tax=Panicum virgatum TaxID=38727 RepID=UPI0019D51054|nr:uncharacterized protein LOC120710433 isoform X1 [Panicum virgatum]